MHKQHGLSIIELMVALLISSFLIIGITQVYLDNRENTLFQQSQDKISTTLASPSCYWSRRWPRQAIVAHLMKPWRQPSPATVSARADR